MALGRGVISEFGLVAGSTWGLKVTPATLDEIRVTAAPWSDNIEELQDASYNNDAHAKETTLVGRYRVDGSFTCDVKYEGLEQVAGYFFGDNSALGAGPTYFVHRYFRKSSMVGIFATIAIDDGFVLHEIDSAKLNSLTFAATAGGVVTMEVGWLGRLRIEGTTGSLSLTESTNVDRVQFLNTTAGTPNVDYQFTTQTADSLADIEINSWSVTFERVYDDDDRVFTSSDSPYRREMSAGAMNVTGTITIPHDTAAHMTTEFHAGTTGALKLKHILDANQDFGVYLPSLTWTGATANMTDKGSLPQVLNFRADLADAAPATFSVTSPYVEWNNKNSVDPLA